MPRVALWCVLSLAVGGGCTLLGQAELDDKPSEDGGGGATVASATSASSGPAGPGPAAGPGGGGPGCDSGCAAGTICEGNKCVCESPKAPVASSCPSECSGGCDESKGLCHIDRQNECQGSCKPIVCPAGMDCEIRCKGTKACYQAAIQCPESFACKVECDGYQACSGSHLVGTTGALTLTCKELQACWGMDLDCGAGKCDYPCLWDGEATCGNSCNCNGC